MEKIAAAGARGNPWAAEGEPVEEPLYVAPQLLPEIVCNRRNERKKTSAKSTALTIAIFHCYSQFYTFLISFFTITIFCKIIQIIDLMIQIISSFCLWKRKLYPSARNQGWFQRKLALFKVSPDCATRHWMIIWLEAGTVDILDRNSRRLSSNRAIFLFFCVRFSGDSLRTVIHTFMTSMCNFYTFYIYCNSTHLLFVFIYLSF